MTAKQLTCQQLPIILATGVLSAGLLLSGCSNNENNESVETTPVASDDNTAVVTTQNSETTGVNDTDTSTAAMDNATVNKTISPTVTEAKEPSLLTNSTKVGTAENTVKLAIDTLYYGDAEKAATYYKVDMENFAEALKNTQFTFQQTVEAVTITDTKYNSDKTHATVTGKLMLKDQKQPAPLTYELQKIDGEWKILG